MINAKFRKIGRLFAQSFKVGDNDPAINFLRSFLSIKLY